MLQDVSAESYCAQLSAASSHTLTTPSLSQDASRRPSPLHATPRTGARWPDRVTAACGACCAWLMRIKCTRQSSPPAASSSGCCTFAAGRRTAPILADAAAMRSSCTGWSCHGCRQGQDAQKRSCQPHDSALCSGRALPTLGWGSNHCQAAAYSRH